jgi:hypothetical protein
VPVGHRWAVVDVTNDGRRQRITMTFRTRLGALRMRRRWVARHKRENCWPECPTLWHYEVKSLRRLSTEVVANA